MILTDKFEIGSVINDSESYENCQGGILPKPELARVEFMAYVSICEGPKLLSQRDASSR